MSQGMSRSSPSAERVIKLLEAHGGAASCRQLLAAGCSRRSVEAMVRRGELVRVRRDAVVLASSFEGAPPWGRRHLITTAVGRSLAPAAVVDPGDGRADLRGVHAISHASALMLHGLPYLGDGGVVHLVRTDGARGRRDATAWVHRPVPDRWVGELDGLRVVIPELAALQVAAADGPEAGVVALDGVLRGAEEADLAAVGRRHGPARRDVDARIARALEELFGRSAPVLREVVELADGRSESVGESRTRWLVRALGLGPCVPQFEVRDGALLVGRVDLKLARWDVLVEFDGTTKYTHAGALVAEKDREDRLRSLGYEVVRIRWADLARPHLVRRRLLDAIARAEARAALAG